VVQAPDWALRSGSYAGQVWGDFALGELIGWGGMGAVYRGRQVSLDRAVAIKVLGKHLSENESFRRRFVLEARAVARLSSPHVVQIYSAGAHDGHHFFVMELVDGVDLAHKLREGFRPSNAAAFDLMLQAARGLAAAGKLGIVHRDIKPANMLITGEGVLKLSDFGLAKLVSEERGATDDEQRLTATGIIVGTAAYFSPEQGRGERCDQRTDLYALGVVAYELLTGRLPFTAADTTSVIYQHVHEAPRPPRTHNPTVHPDFEAAVLRCLAKKPEARFQSAAELVQELERLAVAGRISDHRRRFPWRWAAAAAALLVVIAATSAFAMVGRPHAPPATVPGSLAHRDDEPEPLEVRHQSLADVAGQTAPTPASTLPALPPQAPPEPSPAPRPAPAAVATEPPAPPVRAPAFAPAPVRLSEPETTEQPSFPQPAPGSVTLPAPLEPAPVVVAKPTPSEPAPSTTVPHLEAHAPAAAPATTPRTPSAPIRPAAREDDPSAVVEARPLPSTARAAREASRDANGRFADLQVLGQTLRFRWCPPGRFNMGSPDDEAHRSHDEDIHQVTLTRGFWLADSECTQALWTAVMGDDPSAHQELELPVEQVSWQQVQDFLERFDRLMPTLDARLPSEAEWEYAARAGDAGAAPAKLEASAWSSRSSEHESHAVRQLAPNAWGIYDMLGNVAEWCQDSYGEYEKPVVTDPPPRLDGAPVIRGGSFRDAAGELRYAHRDHERRDFRSARVGFRLAFSSLPGIDPGD
jgi:formylglycine-generating enzyme required for sulfatase activity